MPYTPITPLPAVPNRSDAPETFSDDVDSFLSALPTLQEQINASGAYIDTVGEAVDADAAAALLSKNAAATSETNAYSSASAASYKGLWSAQTGAANKPYTVFHNGSFWALNNNLANVTTSTPSLTNADWQFVSGTRWQPLMTASATVARNAMHQISATSGAVDATLPASMAVGDFVVVANSNNSTQTVRVVNNGYTIYGESVTITTSDNITIVAGDSVSLRCVATNTLEVYR